MNAQGTALAVKDWNHKKDLVELAYQLQRGFVWFFALVVMITLGIFLPMFTGDSSTTFRVFVILGVAAFLEIGLYILRRTRDREYRDLGPHPEAVNAPETDKGEVG